MDNFLASVDLGRIFNSAVWNGRNTHTKGGKHGREVSA